MGKFWTKQCCSVRRRRRGPVTPGSERIRSKPSAASYGSGGGQRDMKPVEETTSESMALMIVYKIRVIIIDIINSY